jgi:hypothetical protein
MAATPAQTIQFEFVRLDYEAVAPCHFFLKPLDLTILEFHDLAATGADQMIVVAFVTDIVVLRLRSEVSRLGEPGFTEQIERAIDGRQTDVGIFPVESSVHLFGRNVLVLQEGVQNLLSLPREFQLMLREVGFEGCDFFRMSRHWLDLGRH